jgi:hypothetical protein
MRWSGMVVTCDRRRHDGQWSVVAVVIIAIRCGLLHDRDGVEAVVLRPGNEVLVQHVDLRGVWRVLLREPAHLHLQALHPLRDGMILRHERVVGIVCSGRSELQRIKLLSHTTEGSPETPDLGPMKGLRPFQSIDATPMHGIGSPLYVAMMEAISHVPIEAQPQIIYAASMPCLRLFKGRLAPDEARIRSGLGGLLRPRTCPQPVLIPDELVVQAVLGQIPIGLASHVVVEVLAMTPHGHPLRVQRVLHRPVCRAGVCLL